MAYTTIKKPSDYFNTKLYTGNGSTNAITGVGFQPDLVWTKCRSTINSSRLIDNVRGVTKAIVSNSDGAELTETNGLSAFGSDGYTLNGNLASMNTNGDTYASWNWLASNTTASNTDGSITSTVSASTVSGFSIVSYTGNGSAGATIGHGLGSAVKFLWVKNRDDAGENHTIWHQDIPNTNALFLNSTDGSNSYTTRWNSTTPTSSVFTVGTSNGVNGNTKNYIAYCFAEKKGFSKFGSYTGNGSTDGTFVYTGFKPAFVMVKPTVTADNWVMFDNKRVGYNVDNRYFYANKNFAEGTADLIDFTSNGFKQRSSGGTSNRSGEPFIYMAFASEPLVGSNNVCATAR
jgi:hypothetical protein